MPGTLRAGIDRRVRIDRAWGDGSDRGGASRTGPARGPRGLSRREFLGASLGTLGALGVGAGCATPVLEGVCTSKFTYLQGEPIVVRAGIHSPATIQFSLARMEMPYSIPAGGFSAYVPTCSMLASDITSLFSVVQLIPSDGLPPGVYELSMPTEALLPANLQSNWNGYPADNWRCYFAVTDPVAGSRSKVLFLLDTLTSVAYGSFGNVSIYGPGGTRPFDSVPYVRPGVGQQVAQYTSVIPFLNAHGYPLEYIDLLALHQQPAGFLDAYDLVLAFGQFEYISNEVMVQLKSFLDGGGSLYSAAHEFAAFRVRLDTAAKTMTTYKWDYAQEDPDFGTGDPALDAQVAGVGMAIPAEIWETEITGQFEWAAGDAGNGASIDMPLYHVDEASWILAGTGLGAGDVLPSAFYWYAAGNIIAFDGSNQPYVTDTATTRQSPDTVVWAASPSSDGRVWTIADGTPQGLWPTFDGWATATWRQLPSGGEIVSYPSATTAVNRVTDPTYDRIMLNVMARLSSR